jgi:hypothetical protein
MRRILAIVAAAVALAACLPVTTKSPIGSTVGYKSDPALYGMWKGAPPDNNDNHDIAYFAIMPGDEGEATVVFIDMPTPVKSGDWSTYEVKTTTLGPYRYLDARARMADGKPAEGPYTEKSFPVLYRIEADGTLALYLIDEEAAKAAVKAGKIAGDVGRGDYGDVELTAEPKTLDALLASRAGRALFTKPLIVLHKVS